MKTHTFLSRVVVNGLFISCLALWSPQPWADQNDPQLDRLFSALLGADDLAHGSRITEEIWQRWRQVDDPAIEDLLASGIAAMNAHDLGLALDSFHQVIEKAPEFAEGWNKRATVYYLIGLQPLDPRYSTDAATRTPTFRCHGGVCLDLT
jgi:hypothetical protein